MAINRTKRATILRGRIVQATRAFLQKNRVSPASKSSVSVTRSGANNDKVRNNASSDDGEYWSNTAR